jgi:hypothetical protein
MFPAYMTDQVSVPIEKEAKDMAEPVVVTIPHKLTKEEAIRRLKKGFGDVRSTFGEKFVVLTDDWAGDHLDFKASLLGQTTTGTVDVGEHSVRLEVQLPWMLALLANKAKAIVQKKGQLMLEKPTKTTTTT